MLVNDGVNGYVWSRVVLAVDLFSIGDVDCLINTILGPVA